MNVIRLWSCDKSPLNCWKPKRERLLYSRIPSKIGVGYSEFGIKARPKGKTFIIYIYLFIYHPSMNPSYLVNPDPYNFADFPFDWYCRVFQQVWKETPIFQFETLSKVELLEYINKLQAEILELLEYLHLFSYQRVSRQVIIDYLWYRIFLINSADDFNRID